MTIDAGLFYDVFDLTSVSYAIASGLAFGAGPLLYMSLRWPAKEPVSTRIAVAATAISVAAMGSLFFAGQVVQAYAADPLWPRALGRMALWEVFSVAVGLGLGITRSFAKNIEKPPKR